MDQRYQSENIYVNNTQPDSNGGYRSLLLPQWAALCIVFFLGILTALQIVQSIITFSLYHEIMNQKSAIRDIERRLDESESQPRTEINYIIKRR